MTRRRNRAAAQPATPAAPAVAAKAVALPQRRLGLLLLAIGLEAVWLLLLALLAWWS